MFEFWTQTSGLFGSLMTLVIVVIFPQCCGGWVLRIVHLDSSFAFSLHVFCAIWTCTLLSLRGIGLEIPSDHISLDSPSLNFFAPRELGHSQRRWRSQFQHERNLYLPSMHPWDTICPGCFLRLNKCLLFFYNLNFFIWFCGDMWKCYITTSAKVCFKWWNFF